MVFSESQIAYSRVKSMAPSMSHLLIPLSHALRRCCMENEINNIQEAYRIGKLAMSALKHFDSALDQVPKLCYLYHGFVSIYSEPVQSSAESLHKGMLQEAMQ